MCSYSTIAQCTRMLVAVDTSTGARARSPPPPHTRTHICSFLSIVFSLGPPACLSLVSAYRLTQPPAATTIGISRNSSHEDLPRRRSSNDHIIPRRASLTDQSRWVCECGSALCRTIMHGHTGVLLQMQTVVPTKIKPASMSFQADGTAQCCTALSLACHLCCTALSLACHLCCTALSLACHLCCTALSLSHAIYAAQLSLSRMPSMLHSALSRMPSMLHSSLSRMPSMLHSALSRMPSMLHSALSHAIYAAQRSLSRMPSMLHG